MRAKGNTNPKIKFTLYLKPALAEAVLSRTHERASFTQVVETVLEKEFFGELANAPIEKALRKALKID